MGRVIIKYFGFFFVISSSTAMTLRQTDATNFPAITLLGTSLLRLHYLSFARALSSYCCFLGCLVPYSTAQSRLFV
ncbi:hypothetical protein BDR04DRAFT_1093763 [Suillus decipiens]|nr:hypothetical protein BDR04DRAFT_1093763 [Suillus decipiens]